MYYYRIMRGGIVVTTNQYCQLQIGLLGPFYLVVDQQEINEDVWKSKKALTMLKYLAAKKGQRVSTDVLIELLWPDNEDVDSMSNLHTAVWFVRRILTSKEKPGSESRLHYASGSYWLELSEGCLDLDLFEDHVHKSRQLMATNPEMALLHCESALELYRGDFLSEEIYDEWTISYREDYQELYFEIILRLAELRMSYRDDLHGAIEILRSAVKEDPFREELYQMGIKFYILAERHVDAVNLYKRYSTMLMDEFQLQPSQATQDLILQLHNRGTEQAATGTLSFTIEQQEGAHVCDPNTMLFVINTEQRRLSRGGNHFALLLVGNKNAPSRNSKMQPTMHILRRSLRNSDLMSQYSDDLILVFLPDTDNTSSQALLRRIKRRLKEKLQDISSLSCSLLHSESIDEMKRQLESMIAQ